MKAFDEIAGEWNESRKRPFSALELFLPEIRETDLVLDAGCGNGRNLMEIARHCKEVYGIDSSHEMVKNARERIHEAEVRNAGVVDGNIIALPFADGFFDQVYCSAVIHHLKELEQRVALKEVARVLKRGGKFFVTVWAERKLKNGKEGIVEWRSRNGRSIERYYYFFEKEELETKAKEAGFKIINSVYERDGSTVEKEKAANLCILAERDGG